MSTPYATFPHWSAGASGQPVLVLSRDPSLVAVLERLAAAAGAELDVRSDPPSLGRWAAPGLVIIAADLVAVVAGALPRRSGLFVVGLDDGVAAESVGAPTGTAIWQHALELGAERVTFLPTEQEWVVGALSETLDGSHRAVTVGVVGGCGGAGASVLAAAVAVTATGQGHRTLLVDLDPVGGGVDLLLGAERSPGLRWPELAGARGRLSGGMLREALPRLDGLSLLSWDRADTATAAPLAPEASAAVVDGARRGFDLVVLDLPRALDLVPTIWLRTTDVGLVVLPASTRALAAAARVVAPCQRVIGDLRAVVRGPCRSGWSAHRVGDAIGLAVQGELAPEPGLTDALERGEPPGLRRRAPLARFAARFLDEMPGLRAAA